MCHKLAQGIGVRTGFSLQFSHGQVSPQTLSGESGACMMLSPTNLRSGNIIYTRLSMAS